MSARDDLIWRVTQAGLSEQWAVRQVDNYARELANRQRRHLGAHSEAGTLELIDLIDPDKEQR